MSYDDRHSHNRPPPYSIHGHDARSPDHGHNMGYEHNEDKESRKMHAFRQLRTHGLVMMVLSLLAIGSGVAVLVVASDNVAFPTFNFGPILVGIVVILGGLLAWRAGTKGIHQPNQPELSGNVKCGIIGHFVICVACIAISCLSAVFGLLAAGVCFDPDEVIANQRGGGTVNLSKACEPNKTGNAIAGLVAGIVCLLIALWCIFGTCFLCCYGRSFGFSGRYGRGRGRGMSGHRMDRMGPQGGYDMRHY